jgi:hypothetical protein
MTATHKFPMPTVSSDLTTPLIREREQALRMMRSKVLSADAAEPCRYEACPAPGRSQAALIIVTG